jgi:hypothetical protein
MRLILAAVAATAFTATAAAAPDSDPCAQTRSKKVTLEEGRELTVTATTIPGPVAPEGGGDNCRLATALLTIHTSEGYAVVTYAAPLIAASYDLGHTEAPAPAAATGAFLDSWINVEIGTADTAPASTDEGVATTLSAEDYDAIKKAKAPTVCFKESEHITSCYAPDSSGYLIPFYEREQT